MPNKVTYTITTADGKEHQVSKENVDKYGIQSYADAYKGATIRMRDAQKGDYDIPLQHFDNARKQGLHAFSLEHTPVQKQAAPKPTPTSSVTTAATPQDIVQSPRPQSQKDRPMTAVEKASMISNVGNIVNTTQAGLQRTKNMMTYAKSKAGLHVEPVKLGKKNNVVETAKQYNPKTGKMQSHYLTEAGNEYDDKTQADIEQADIDDQKRRELDPVQSQLEDAYSERDRLEEAVSARRKELEDEYNNRPWYQRILTEMGKASHSNVDPAAISTDPEHMGFAQDEQYMQLMSAIRKNHQTIQTLEDKKNGQMNSFWHSLGTTLANGYIFADGLPEMRDATAILNAQKHIDSINRKRKTGQALTKEEAAAEAVLHNTQIDNVVQGTYGSEYGAWARAGRGTAYSADFMKDFLLFPAAANIAKGVAGKVAGIGGKYLAKAAGETAVKATAKAIARATLKATGVVVGAHTAGAVISNTTGIGRTVAKMGQLSAGDVSMDKNGNYKMENQQDLMSAFAEAEREQVRENGSEMFGEFIPGGKVLSGAAKKALSKIGLGRISDMLTNIGNKAWYKNYTTLLEKGGYNGIPGEALEEYEGMFFDAITGHADEGLRDFTDPKQQVDIWLGCATMGALMGAVPMGLHFQGYYRYKQGMNKADRTADFRLTPQKWQPLKEQIDQTDNGNMAGFVVDKILNNKSLEPQEKEAAMNYVRNLTKFRGFNIAQVNNADDEAKDTQIESRQQNEAYSMGYNLQDEKELNNTAILYDEAKKQATKATGWGEDTLESMIGEDGGVSTLAYMKHSDEFNDGQLQAFTDYANARAAYNGMIQRVKDDIDTKVHESELVVDQRTNLDTGAIHPATMKVDDRQVYIVNGNVVMLPDGSGVDHEHSDDFVVLRDAETGELETADPSAIFKVDAPINVQEEKEVAADNIRQTFAQQQADKIDGKLEFKQGDTYSIIDKEDGTQHSLSIIGDAIDENTGQVNPEMVLVDIDGAQQPILLPKEQVQQQVDEARRAAVAATQVVENAPTTNTNNTYSINDEVTLSDENGNAVRGSITAPENEDGKFEVYTEQPINGKKVNLFSAEELDAITKAPETVAENATVQQPQQQEETEESVEKETPKQQPTALERIPKDESGQPLYEQAEPETAWDAIVEQTEGDTSMAQTVADDMVSDLEAGVKKAEKTKAKSGGSIAEKIAAEKERVAVIEQAKATLAHWRKIAAVNRMREAVIQAEEQRKADEVARVRKEQEEKERVEQEEAERIKREALNGVPDFVEDKATDARARGYRRVNGDKVDRQEPINATKGKEVQVKFDDDNIPTGHVAIIEANQLQPSHKNGQRNPQHFIDEAQPKERKDDASVGAARKIAANIRPEEITSSVTAYTGAPTVNSRGEVIQGNNRSAALREMWDNHQEQGDKYKKYLIDNAESFGLRPEDIVAMDKPVLVNMLDVNDDEAISLGQFVASDTESGGTERIKPKNVVKKLGDKMKNFANILLRANDENISFAELIDSNGVDALKWLNANGMISPTQYKSAFDSKGNITAEAKNDIKGIMYQSIFEGGNTQLEEMFNALPAKAQKAILATAYRDYDSPQSERMIVDIQDSIMAYYALSHDSMFMNAKNHKDARIAVEAWRRQLAFDDVTGESYLPAEKYSNFALLLATMYKGDNQSLIQGTFNKMYDLIQGTQEETLFEQPDNTPRSLVQAIKETLNIEYNGQQGSNVLAGDNSASQEGRTGSNGDATSRGRSEDIDGAEANQGGTEGDTGRSGSGQSSGGSQEEVAAENSHLTKKEAADFIAQMELGADVAQEIPLTIENWDKEFGEDGIVSTPIGDVKMGENQFAKLMRAGRNGKLGMLKPTLEYPDAIVEENSKAKEGMHTERPSSFIFIKSFRKSDGTRYYYFTSITVSVDGKEVVVSNQEKSRNRILRLLMEGSVIWRTPKDATTSSAEKQGLDYVHPDKAEGETKGSEITPQNTPSVGKDKQSSATKQEKTENFVPSPKNSEEIEEEIKYAQEALDELKEYQKRTDTTGRTSVDENGFDSEDLYIPLLLDGKSSRLGVLMSIPDRITNPSGQVATYDYSNDEGNADWQKWDDLAEEYNKDVGSEERAYTNGDVPILRFKSVDAAVRFADWLNSKGIIEHNNNSSDEDLFTMAERVAAEDKAKRTRKKEEAKVDTNPTEAQKEAGNYKKGHIKVDGFNVTIEQPKGSVRRGKDANGKEWETEMHNTYGYIRGTESVDGDHIDIFLSDNPAEGNVFVVDQVNKDGSFDEHKVMYGFSDMESARKAYLSNYEEGWQGLGNITEVSKEEFKKWIDSSKRKTKPFAEYSSVKTEGDVNVQYPIEDNGSKRLVSNERYEELKKRMRSKLGQLNLGVDPEMLAIGAEMAVYHIENGARAFGAYAKEMISDLGDAIRPYLKAFYNGARDLPEMTELSSEMTPYDEVSRFDVATIGNEGEQLTPSAIETAEQINNEATVEFNAKQEQNNTNELEDVDNDAYSITKQHNNKKDVDIWVVRGKERTDKDIYTQRKQVAKEHNGYYSSFRGVNGFVFNSAEEAHAFADAIFNTQSEENYTQNSEEIMRKDILSKEESVENQENKSEEEIVSKENVRKAINAYEEAQEKFDNLFSLLVKEKESKPFDSREWREVNRTKEELKDVLLQLNTKELGELLKQVSEKDTEYVIKNVLDIVNRKEHRLIAFNAILDKQSYITPEYKEEKKAIPVSEFVETDKKRAETHIMLTGVFHDKGYVVGTDAHLLLARKEDYDKSLEGKVTNKKGEVINGKYPNWRAVVNSGKQGKSWGVNLEELHAFTRGVLTKLKTEKANPSIKKDAKIAFKTADGKIVLCYANALDKALQGAKSIGAKSFFDNDDVFAITQTPKGYVICPMLNQDQNIDDNSFVYSNLSNIEYEDGSFSELTAEEPLFNVSSSIRSFIEGNLFSEVDFSDSPNKNVNQAISKLTDDELLKEIAKGDSKEWNFYMEEYDRRHNKEFQEAVERYMNSLEDEKTSLDTAYGSYINVAKNWSNGGYHTTERTLLRAQLDAIEDYVSKKESEQLSSVESEAYHQAKETVRKVGYDLTRLRLRPLEEGEACHVERRYTESNGFSFTGKEHVESIEDIAYIFKQLETSSVENSFLVLIKDGTPTVLHLSIGSYATTLAPIEQAIVAADAINPDKVLFVHNHPSGNISASKQDMDVQKKMKEIFGGKVMPAIIINTTSGKFGTFSEDGQLENGNIPLPDEYNNIPINVYQFSQQVFAKDWNPEFAFRVVSPESIAEYVSSHRLGKHKKMSLIILDQAGHITGNVFLPWTKLTDVDSHKNIMQIISYVNQMGGRSAILYGNYELGEDTRDTNKSIFKIKTAFSNSGLYLMDVINIDDSAHDRGAMEEDVEYGKRNLDEEVNEQFNRELAELTEENAQSKRLKLGYPSPMLSAAGVPDKPIILYGNKLLKKAKLHNFDVKELHNLPLAMQNPIAVFEGSHLNSFATLLEIKLGGHNTLVSIEVNKKGEADFNFISSLFGKESKGVTKWILDGKLLSVDKEKAQSYISASALNADATYKNELSSAAKIVKDFDNPVMKGENILRDGTGNLSDDELSMNHDPVAKMLGKSNRTEEDHKAFAERERQRMISRISELADRLHLNNIETVTDSNSLQGKKAKAKGFYSKSSGKITIVIPNHASVEDVEKTLLHEAVAHYGLRKLFGEHFETFLDNVYQNVEPEIRRIITRQAANNNWDFRTATEEYLAGLAERTDFERVHYAIWNKIKSLFLKMLHSIGFEGWSATELSDNELRYLLWRSYENMKEPGRYRSILGEAEDIAKQNELKVGNYDQQDTNSSNVAERGILYREDDSKEKERVNAREQYEQRVNRAMFQTQEALQDSMLGLKEAMNAITKAEGKNVNIEDIDGYENAYLGENRLSSVNKAEADAFAHLLFKPMLAEVSKLCKNAQERAELVDYMMAKHGLERNAVMRKRAIEDILNNEKLSDAQKSARAGLAEYRDYAGLTALTGKDNVTEAEVDAETMVSEYENTHDTTNLWDKVNAVNAAILSKSYECGMMDKDTYEKISDMYKYYIPLRGFDETTSEEAYAYLLHQNSAFNAPIKVAKGRSSKADDPFANMQSMAESAITQGNRNKLVKQRFFNFVLNHPSDLVSISDMWLKYDDVADEWKPVFPDNFEENDSAEDIEQKLKEFEDKMKKLAEQAPDKYKHGKETTNIPYRVVDSRDLHQHQVLVKHGGRDYILTLNGNPRAAQALNGQTNPDNDTSGAIGAILKAGEMVNRQLSAFYTTRNPDFVVSNFIRDMLFSNSIVWVKESPNYALCFHRNIARCNPAQIKVLLAKHRKGTLDMNNKLEHMFYQFMMNGGETGYANVRDIEQHKNDIRRELKRANGKLSITKAFNLLGEKLDEYNRAVENCARFAAYLTSREMGRTVERSIYDAKEISVNFNKKGSGAKFMNAVGQTKIGTASAFVSGIGRSGFVFWNAAIQGTTNFGRQFKKHPAKAFTASAIMFLLGAVIAGIGMGDGDDDADANSYWNLPEYVRRSNILFKIGDQWVSIPLPVEYRAIYGMGELMVSAMSGKEHFTGSELGKAIAGQATQILPIDFLEGGGGVKAFVPSAVKPFAEVYSNKGWTGMPIYKDTPYNKYMPEWTKAYKSANKYLVGIAKTLNEATGGDAYTKGSVDINPAQIEYLLNGYFGGVSGTIDKLSKSAETIAGDREYDPRNFLLLNRILKNGDERTEARAINNEYMRVKEEHDVLKARMKHYENDTDKGLFDYADKIDFLYNSPEFARYEIFEDYSKDIDALYQELKESNDGAEHLSIEKELTELKKEMIEEMNKTRK